MAEKLSDKLKKLFSKTRNAPVKGAYPAKFERTAFKAGQKTSSMMKALKPSSFMKAVDKPASASRSLVTASAAKKLRTASKVAKLARVATPLGLGTVAAQAVYDVATMSPEKKAKVKKLKTKLSKKSTKDYHADLLKMSTGGDTMLQNSKKADLDKDGKLSGYEKKRAKAIESNMKQKPIKAVLGIATMGLLGAKMLSDKKKKKAIKAVSPVAMLADATKEEKNQVTTGQQTARKGKMMKAKTGKDVDIDLMEKIAQQSLIGKGAMKTKVKKRSMGGKIMKAYEGAEAKGYGAARTQGDGLSDENLIPGKSLDYYKDIM